MTDIENCLQDYLNWETNQAYNAIIEQKLKPENFDVPKHHIINFLETINNSDQPDE